MSREISPHPRFRLYTTADHYRLPLSALLRKPGGGEETAKFESAVCRHLRVEHAVCVPSARIGIYLSVRALVPPGRKVVLSPLTIADVVNMVIAAGAIPVFADVRRNGYHIDPEEVERLAGPDTGAVLITHLFGETAGACRLREICRAREVPLIEDAAQAFGASEIGRPLGTWGDVGVFSFGLFKHLTTWRGGMLIAPSGASLDAIRKEVRLMPLLGRWRLLALLGFGFATGFATRPSVFWRLVYPVFRWAFLHKIGLINRLVDPEAGARRLDSIPRPYLGRMTEAQTRLGLMGLERVDDENEIRRSNAERYRAGLSGLEGLILPADNPSASPAFPYFPVQCPNRDQLLRWAFERRRDWPTHGLRNCADLPAFRSFHRDCPNARQASESLILLPTYPRYPLAEIERNIKVIREFFGSSAMLSRASFTSIPLSEFADTPSVPDHPRARSDPISEPASPLPALRRYR
ncbi:MAG: DegT/DnrJ/EryC1/StrS aminotransferase family protein [Acidobacteria bacterium]|nr:MAG: DegT/DnrJ/EryC1/StrS aminotransferase family protein [Acidobacteriota bacterium]